MTVSGAPCGRRGHPKGQSGLQGGARRVGPEAQRDPDPDVCQASAVALGKMGREATPAVLKALASESADTRSTAPSRRRCARPPSRPFRPWSCAWETPTWKSAVAASALGRLGRRGATADPGAGEQGRRDPAAGRARPGAGGQVGEISDEAVDRGRRGRRPRVKAGAASALGLIGEPAAVPALTALLRDKEVTVRRAAAEALGEIGPAAKAAVDALLALMKEPARAAARPPRSPWLAWASRPCLPW